MNKQGIGTLPIDKQIEIKRAKLMELQSKIAPLANAGGTVGRKSLKVNALQDKLELRVKQFELALLDEKIPIFEEVLSILKN